MAVHRAGIDRLAAALADFATFLGGALNAVAGGGSFLSFPALLGIGLGPIQANATNTVAMWPGQLTSIAGYWGEVRKHPRLGNEDGWGWPGGRVGWRNHSAAYARADVSGSRALAAALRRARLCTERAGDEAAPEREPAVRDALSGFEDETGRKSWLAAIATMAICFYIGYFGAGAGFLIISLLSLFGFTDLNEMNAMKVVSTTMANGVACILFAFSGKVEWHVCLAAMVSCAIGGYLSARISQRLNPRLLRVMVVVVGLGMAAYFFWRNHR